MSLALRDTRFIYFIAILASLFLSWDGAIRGAILNPDGICYLQSALTYGTASYSDAMHLCGQAQWPFYSYIIYLFSSLTRFSVLLSAFMLNGLFSLISVAAFIYIAKLLGGSRRVMWLAAFVILLAHEFNSVREYIIRDHGFWAFYLVSFACLIQFIRSNKFIFALGWSVAMLLATLFRIEGLIFLLFIPVVVFFQFDKSFLSNLQQFFKLSLLLILISVSGIAFLFMQHHLQQGIPIHRVSEVQYQLTHGLSRIFENFNDKADALGKNVLSVYSARDAHVLLFILLVTWLVLSIVTNASTIYSVLFGYAVFSRAFKKDNAATLVLYAYLIVNVLICSIFLTEFMFLSKRYLIALTLVIMMWVPFALDYLLNQKRILLFNLAVFFIFLTALGGVLDFGYSKQYISDAGQWLHVNAPINAAIYSNDYQVLYYSQHFGNKIFAKETIQFIDPNVISNGHWKQFDFLAVRINKKDPATFNELQSLHPEITFANKRGDRVIIYKVPHEENLS